MPIFGGNFAPPQEVGTAVQTPPSFGGDLLDDFKTGMIAHGLDYMSLPGQDGEQLASADDINQHFGIDLVKQPYTWNQANQIYDTWNNQQAYERAKAAYSQAHPALAVANDVLPAFLTGVAIVGAGMGTFGTADAAAGVAAAGGGVAGALGAEGIGTGAALGAAEGAPTFFGGAGQALGQTLSDGAEALFGKGAMAVQATRTAAATLNKTMLGRLALATAANGGLGYAQGAADSYLRGQLNLPQDPNEAADGAIYGLLGGLGGGLLGEGIGAIARKIGWLPNEVASAEALQKTIKDPNFAEQALDKANGGDNSDLQNAIKGGVMLNEARAQGTGDILPQNPAVNGLTERTNDLAAATALQQLNKEADPNVTPLLANDPVARRANDLPSADTVGPTIDNTNPKILASKGQSLNAVDDSAAIGDSVRSPNLPTSRTQAEEVADAGESSNRVRLPVSEEELKTFSPETQNLIKDSSNFLQSDRLKQRTANFLNRCMNRATS